MEDILDIEEQIVKGSWPKRHPFRSGLLTVGCILILQIIIAKIMHPYELMHYNMPSTYKPDPDYYQILKPYNYALAALQLVIPNLVFMLLARNNAAWQGFEYLAGMGFRLTGIAVFFALMILFAGDVNLVGLIFVSVACFASAATLGAFSSALMAMILRKDGL